MTANALARLQVQRLSYRRPSDSAR
jgi:hypothetical protein